MKVAYLGRPTQHSNQGPKVEGNAIELLYDNWDDYGYKTSFPVSCRINDEILELGLIRLLVEEEWTTRTVLDRLRDKGWDGIFPIPDVNYISIPSDITFYEQISGVLDCQEAIGVAELLHDASYLVRIADNAVAKTMVQSRGFEKSLQRERGSIKAYLDGWRIFERQSIAILDLGFKFTNVFGRSTTLEIKFQPENRLPHDINVLIGPNGSGKSQLLHQIVRDWIAPSDDGSSGFVEKPNLSQIVVVSYSPFEKYPVDFADQAVQDKGAYRYFGFRHRAKPTQTSKRGRITLSRQFPSGMLRNRLSSV